MLEEKMMVAVKVRSDRSLATVVRSEEDSRNDTYQKKHVPPPKSPSLPFLSITKPSWLVKTESNVRKEIRKKPEPPCAVCKGTGRIDCHECSGKGRTNHADLAMLPRGEWPKWCRACGGSGLGYCSRCLGTGEYRYIMGFHFMNTEDHSAQPNKPPRQLVDGGDLPNSNY